MYNYGPCRHFMTAANERGLSEFKAMVTGNRSPINQIIEKSKFQAIHFVQEVHDEGVRGGKARPLSTVTDNSTPLPPGLPEIVLIHKSLRFQGCFYAPGLAICLSVPKQWWLSSLDPPNFYKISQVFSSETKVFLLAKKLEVLELDRSLSSFNVKEVACPEEFIDTEALIIRQTFSIKNMDDLDYLIADSLPFKIY